MSLTSTAPQGVPPAARPPLDELMERAASLRPTLAQMARATEDNRKVSADTMRLLADHELLSLTRPAAFGGFEYGPSSLVRLGYELGQACGSTAWCAALVNCNAWFTAYWPRSAQQEVWQSNPENLVAAPLAPTGRCRPAEGGYLVSGRWPFASNCENSDWAIISAMVPEHDGLPSGPCWFLTPMSTLQVDQDTWHMAGLQGTGSKTLYAEEPVFVPAARAVWLRDVLALTTPGAGLEANPLARFGWSTFGAAGLIGPLLGMARGALDWFTENMRSKVRPGASATSAHNPFNQERAGRASAELDAALMLVLSDLAQVEETILGGARITTAQRIRTRRDFGFATRTAVDVVNALYDAAGASAAELDRPIQRLWRDTNAAAGHVSLDERSIMALAGQELFGVPTTGPF